jgi:hypothetical protein
MVFYMYDIMVPWFAQKYNKLSRLHNKKCILMTKKALPQIFL